MRRFMKCYRCFPISSTGQLHLENGDKIIMPTSALTSLTSRDVVEYPMLFQLTNPNNKRKVTHCGIMEFTADQGKVFLPCWIMHNMKLREGDLVSVKNVSLKKGTFAKLRPHERAFVELSNPKAVLEKILRGFSCLTTGETIVLDHNEKKYSIDVLQTKPDKAVSIMETDVVVDFAPARDYKEPEKPTTAGAGTGTGTGAGAGAGAEAVALEDNDREEKEEASFQAFHGKSYKMGTC